jgi:hypothetical protein
MVEQFAHLDSTTRQARGQPTSPKSTVIHRHLPDRSTMLKVGAGWHMHLDILVARASGDEPAPFREGWSRLQQEYGRLLPA